MNTVWKRAAIHALTTLVRKHPRAAFDAGAAGVKRAAQEFWKSKRAVSEQMNPTKTADWSDLDDADREALADFAKSEGRRFRDTQLSSRLRSEVGSDERREDQQEHQADYDRH
ncbi:hypothetical protein [Flaviflagellibacter deserti]|uniref:Cation transport regulator ChaB n=1 Tax=Flaviflagellibacter deserti TaxID=2267266 RepID=A0ABV9Z1V0_9HYPH